MQADVLIIPFWGDLCALQGFERYKLWSKGLFQRVLKVTVELQSLSQRVVWMVHRSSLLCLASVFLTLAESLAGCFLQSCFTPAALICAGARAYSVLGRTLCASVILYKHSIRPFVQSG